MNKLVPLVIVLFLIGCSHLDTRIGVEGDAIGKALIVVIKYDYDSKVRGFVKEDTLQEVSVYQVLDDTRDDDIKLRVRMGVYGYDDVWVSRKHAFLYGTIAKEIIMQRVDFEMKKAVNEFYKTDEMWG